MPPLPAKYKSKIKPKPNPAVVRIGLGRSSVCVACEGSGRASKGGRCVPCGGKGILTKRETK